jgi:ATP-dependent DNA helicase RecQ
VSTPKRTRKPTMTDARRVLKRVFALDEFRPGQREIIASILDGADTVGVMPTGAGKSLCYQIPALLLHGTTLVISPLISLMKDQTDKLSDIGLAASPLNSSLTASETSEHLEQIASERAEFVLTTPERLATEEFRAMLRETTVDMVVIDEAHCVSQWGHDFRPAYLEIKEGIAALQRGSKRPPILALTATAPEQVLASIVEELGLRSPRIVNTGIYRRNLHYEVLRTVNEVQKREHLVRLLREQEGIGMIYAATVKQVDEIAAMLEGFGFKVAKYHGRMSAKDRHEVHDRFMDGSLQAIVATNAFGMGIDKPDIRFVIHYSLPGSLEAYYQESGRAGRDGEPSRCILFFQLEDRRTQLYFTGGGRYPKAEDVRAVYEAMQRLGHDGGRIRVEELIDAVDVPRTKLRVILSLLNDLEIITRSREGTIALARPNLSGGNLAAVAETYRTRADADRDKLERMMSYGQSARCRWTVLLEYFAEGEASNACGVCDNCLNPPEKTLTA